MDPDHRQERGQRILDAVCAEAGIERVRFIHMTGKRLATAGVTDAGHIGASTALLDRLNDAEVRAVLGHEIGHFVLGTADPAAPHGKPQAELDADAYSLRLTRDPEALVAALTKIARYNESKESVGAGGRGQTHPSMSRRVHAIQRLARELGLAPRGLARLGHGRGLA